MLTYDIRDASTQLSHLVERAAAGETFVIAVGGRPMVKVVAVEQPVARRGKRLGFMAGEIEVPADFDEMGSAEIRESFEGQSSPVRGG